MSEPMYETERRLLAALSQKPRCGIGFVHTAIHACLTKGWIEDVPWDEKPKIDALRWFRLTKAGRTALASAEEAEQ